MKVQIKNGIASARRTLPAGAVVEMDEEEAGPLVSGGYAVEVIDPPAPEAEEGADEDDPRSTLNVIADLEAELTTAREESGRLTKAVSGLEAEVKTATEATDPLNKKVADLETELTAARGENERLTKSVADLEEKLTSTSSEQAPGPVAATTDPKTETATAPAAPEKATGGPDKPRRAPASKPARKEASKS